MALSCKVVLGVLLAVLCYTCGYGIVYLSYGLYGSIFIYYKAGFTFIWLYAYLRVKPYKGTSLQEGQLDGNARNEANYV